MGGEQVGGAKRKTFITGSSPHGRGTDCQVIVFATCVRFIPAWAGNSRNTRVALSTLSVHPRMGGEQGVLMTQITTPGGSSPHGRGTGSWVFSLAARPRFIPAWAGNRASSSGAAPLFPVHPRMGGEQSCFGSGFSVGSGSSPHGRGTGLFFINMRLFLRFIPAWAGNRWSCQFDFGVSSVHPRMGGEQSKQAAYRTIRRGSSPHGRGTDPYRSCNH